VPLILEYWAQAAHAVPFKTDAYWEHLLRSREEAAHVLELIQEDIARGRPSLGSGDENGLKDEIRAMKAMPGYVRSVLAAME
jgi:hypothetical protein